MERKREIEYNDLLPKKGNPLNETVTYKVGGTLYEVSTVCGGSELLYAFKLYLLSDTEIASNVILGSINQAIAFNFPSTRLRLGFYHQSVKTEEQLSSADRIKNQ